MTEIDIAGLKKEQVLAALYNNAGAVGLGSLHPHQGTTATEGWARQAWRTQGEMVGRSWRGLRRIKHIRFDYLHGRLLKVTFRGTSVDVTDFDRQYGPGTASCTIDRLRRGGSIDDSGS
ncbi:MULTISPECIES: hypothetical protein [Amycolatopsis]|uniref:hypothetical protein n=1 Tax=Amycolatopsis TaxID=1813 RepID=UPI00116036D8|nr:MULTISPECIES: hypothetical protein [Amycolatopsis]